MFTSLFILLFSLAALTYWLRYTVVSVLRREGVAADVERLAEANRLEFLKIRQALEGSTAADYGSLAQALRQDFEALTYLLRYAATVNVGRYSREERLLIVDFHLMRLVCLIFRPFSPRGARFALLEMTSILEHFAEVMGRRMASFSLDMLKA